MELSPTEAALLSLDYSHTQDSRQSTIIQLTINGEFSKVLEYYSEQGLFKLNTEGEVSIELKDGLDEQDLLALAISLLNFYVQLNFVGPAPNPFTIASLFKQFDPTSSDEKDLSKKIDESSLIALSQSGEPAYHLAKSPTLLLLSLKLLGLIPLNFYSSYTRDIPKVNLEFDENGIDDDGELSVQYSANLIGLSHVFVTLIYRCKGINTV
jgi:hypothetical protein